MKKTSVAIITIMVVSVLFASCGKKAGTKGNVEAKGYTFGENVTFHSDELVTYTMSFSDASWYPMQDKWETEGIFADITKLTNVKLALTSYDSNDYPAKVNLAINSGSAAYIIPKVYNEDQYVAGGGIVAVSDYIQYMPNYQAFAKKYNLDPDIDTIRQSDGKYYRLPGLHQVPQQDYTIMIREDIFEAAGYNVRELEKNWTWEDFHDILVGVKKYMVEQGMIKQSDYIWSDLWCGTTSGRGCGGNLLQLISASYGVASGWGIEKTTAAIKFDEQKKEFYCSSLSEDFKKYIKIANSFIKDGLLDPETFTQVDDKAQNAFFTGKTVVKSTNRSMYSGDIDGVRNILGDEIADRIYITVYPIGSRRTLSETSRLENGVMLSKKALDELGEEGFIKMVRFVDWLFYSSEAYSLYKWGPEGKTWHYVNEDGKQVKQLLPGYKCGGLGIGGSESDIDIRLEWGYAGGNFWYGHSTEELTDNFAPILRDLYLRYATYRTPDVIDPKAKPTEDEREQMILWAVPLTDNINAWTLRFVTGQRDVEKDWDEYVASCKNLNVDKLVNLTNEIYKKQNQ